MTYIGLDPGKKGAMAIIESTPDGIGEVKIIPFDPSDYISALKSYSGAVACIEDVHALRGNGITSSFVFGKTYGWLLGVLDALGVSYQAVSVQKWKRSYGLDSDKAKSIEVCKRLLPNVNLKRTDKCRKDDDGCAEACLLALYAKRNF